MALNARGTRVVPVFLTLALASALAVCALLGAHAGSARGQLRPATAAPSPSAGRSVVVYPPHDARLRMNHAHPAHAALACVACHAAAPTSLASSDDLVPHESACVRCHDETARERATPERCGSCHVGASWPRAPEGEAAEHHAGDVVVIPAPTPLWARLTFSHASHARVEGGCERCHAGVRTVAEATRAELPTMDTCLDCHAGGALARSGASSGDDATRTDVDAGPSLACVACHERLPDGRMRARTPDGWMNPPPSTGLHHDHEWLTRHRWVAADDGEACATCHAERDCTDCHDGRVRPRRVHPGDYLATHSTMARRDEGRCTSCHAVSTFCAECHARLGLASFSAPAVRATGRYHPPAAMWIRGPNLHGVEAQRALSTCVACHAENDCVACHGAGSVGGAGVSPHPPGFASSCAHVLQQSPAACVRCHGDVEALAARCR